MRRLMVAGVVLALTLGPEGTLGADGEPAATGAFDPTGSLAAEYVDDPKLRNLLALNGITARYGLSGREQADLHRQGKFEALARCTSERAGNIVAVAQLLIDGQLQTRLVGPRVLFVGAMLDPVPPTPKDLSIEIRTCIDR